MDLSDEVFALRDNEKIYLTEVFPETGRILAIQARSCNFPVGAVVEKTIDGLPVERAALIACEFGQNQQAWSWVQLSPITKRRLGDFLLDNGGIHDKWYYLKITDHENKDSQPEDLEGSR